MNAVKFMCALCSAAMLILCGGCIAEGVHQYELSQEVMNETNPALPRAGQNSNRDVIVYSSPEIYSYEDFLHDMKFICDAHPAQIQAVKLCDTVDGRGVYDIIFGDANGANQVLIFGAISGREYITVQVVMRQLCEILDAANGTYRDKTAAELLQDVTIHFVPNANPDGVAISQFGLLGVNDTALRRNVAGTSGGNTEQWTANARGIDLNKNFADSTPEPEVAALIRLTQDYHIKRAISYRTCGAKIHCGGSDDSKRFAAEISNATDYPLDDSVDGYAAWAVEKLGVPALTVEVGAENGGGVNPVPQYRFDGIWARNKDVVCATAAALKAAEQLTRPTS